MFTSFIFLFFCLALSRTAVVMKLIPKQLFDRPENCTNNVPELPLYYHGKSSYYFEIYLKGSRDSAITYCRNFNMDLVSIEDEEENTFLGDKLESLTGQSTLKFWTSGVKPGDIWYWMRSRKRLTYANWETPTDGRCILINNRNPAVWNIADNCDELHYIICEGSI